MEEEEGKSGGDSGSVRVACAVGICPDVCSQVFDLPVAQAFGGIKGHVFRSTFGCGKAVTDCRIETAPAGAFDFGGKPFE